ncbi:hypothetical protein D3C83_17130 [compost metagenome]
MTADPHFLCELALARLRYRHDAGLVHRHRPDRGRRRLAEVAAGPGREHRRDVRGVLPAGEQVVGIVERNEALGVLCGLEDVRGIVDAHDGIARRMEHQQRLAQLRDGFAIAAVADVL